MAINRSTEVIAGTLSETAFDAAFSGRIGDLKEAFSAGLSVNAVDPKTGLGFLHIAIGKNDSAMTKYLVEEAKVPFFSDRFGRWPSLVAAECRVDDDLSDYVVTKEAEHLRL
jgi:uncharacterized protein